MTIENPVWMQNNPYSARLDRGIIAQLWDEGVMDLASFKVTQRAAGANFSVDVTAGRAVVAGDDQPNQGNYLIHSTAGENRTVTAAPGSNSRYDIVVLRVNDPNAGGGAGDNATIAVIAGTAAASPTVPATPASAILLAVIGPIATATSSITNAIIADARTLAGRRDDAGTAKVWTGAVLPNGWLWEAGQAVSRTTYAALHALYAAAGYPYGAGDGSTTFNVRDMRGRAAVGLDNLGGTDAGRLSVANTLGGTGGAQTVTLTAAQSGSPAHAHPITDPGHAHPPGGGGSFVELVGGGSGNVQTGAGSSIVLTNQILTGANTTQITVNNSTATAASSAHDNMPPYLLSNWIVRT